MGPCAFVQRLNFLVYKYLFVSEQSDLKKKKRPPNIRIIYYNSMRYSIATISISGLEMVVYNYDASSKYI